MASNSAAATASSKANNKDNKTLFISSYNDTITTANLSTTSAPAASNTTTGSTTTYKLTKTHTSHASKPNPAWLSQLPSRNLLVSLNEGLDAPEGSVSIFHTSSHDQDASGGRGHHHAEEGVLKHIETTPTLSGPVSCCFYANDRAMAAAHYSGSGVTTWRVLPSSSSSSSSFSSLSGGESECYSLQHLQTLKFPSFPQPGPVKDRQEAPHPHQVLLDPSGNFLLVPDLGADLVRVFSWDPDGGDGHQSFGGGESLRIEECGQPLRAKPGSGPRHGVFWSPSRNGHGEVYFYLVGELDSSLTAYRVSYHGGGKDKKGLEFEEIFRTSTFGPHGVPDGNAAAEIAVCPDDRTLIVSNRNTLTSSSAAAARENAQSKPDYPIDNLAIFHISDSAPDSTSRSTGPLAASSGSGRGRLSFHRLVDAGARFPRHFSVDPSGTLVAVGSQLDRKVTILRLDDGQEVASLDVGGDVTCVIWAEQ